ncbi:MAG: hypothetical protein ACFFG0_24105, partial [Candidatus Thorarchaeota archaeon]
MKKPSDLDLLQEDINNIFNDQQESEINVLPLVDVFNSINYNPKDIRAKELLANKFNEIRINNFLEELPKNLPLVEEMTQELKKRVETSELDLKITTGDDYEGLFPELDKDMINYIHAKLFDPEYDKNKPQKMLDQIIYRSDLILEAREVLGSTMYNGLKIFVENNINPTILAILQDKYNKGEKRSKLERLIADVASFNMGGPPKIQTTLDGKSILPPKSQRVISQEHKGSSHHTQHF